MHVRNLLSRINSCVRLTGSREFHREQLSIEHSMQDLDSAVGRLDNILMSVYVVVAALIIAVALVGFLSETLYDHAFINLNQGNPTRGTCDGCWHSHPR